MVDFKNEAVWRKAVSVAAGTGCLHASMGAKALTCAKLWALITRDIGQGQDVWACNGHKYLLRRVYGGAYNGVKLSQRAVELRAQAGTQNAGAPKV